VVLGQEPIDSVLVEPVVVVVVLEHCQRPRMGRHRPVGLLVVLAVELHMLEELLVVLVVGLHMGMVLQMDRHPEEGPLVVLVVELHMGMGHQMDPRPVVELALAVEHRRDLGQQMDRRQQQVVAAAVEVPGRRDCFAFERPPRLQPRQPVVERWEQLQRLRQRDPPRQEEPHTVEQVVERPCMLVVVLE